MFHLPSPSHLHPILQLHPNPTPHTIRTPLFLPTPLPMRTLAHGQTRLTHHPTCVSAVHSNATAAAPSLEQHQAQHRVQSRHRCHALQPLYPTRLFPPWLHTPAQQLYPPALTLDAEKNARQSARQKTQLRPKPTYVFPWIGRPRIAPADTPPVRRISRAARRSSCATCYGTRVRHTSCTAYGLALAQHALCAVHLAG